MKIKKHGITLLSVFLIVTIFFAYHLFTNPQKFLSNFVFLSADGEIHNGFIALLKLYYLVISVALVSTCLLFQECRHKMKVFYEQNTLLIIGVTSFLTIYFCSLIFAKNSLFPMLFEEDGVFESVSALLFLLSSILFGIILFKLKTTKHKMTLAMFFLLAIFTFFVGMEEISWGQRIFGWATPSNFAQINYQDETNLHNLDAFESFDLVIYFIAGLLFLAFFGSAYLPDKLTFQIDKALLPGERYIYGAALLPLIGLVDNELFEEILSVLFFTYGFMTYQLVKRSALIKKKLPS